ncbi:MAG: tripartite tricarboxylate transporter substrate binding protein [Deltaproteobacteria bacterium]|nr:tripartite tricarboxylate transporter substrate binding protein [Deltaproteobacteria bacterium]
MMARLAKGLTILSVMAMLLVPFSPALADDFPTKPIKFLIPFNPGGQSDVAALLLRPGLEEFLKVDIVPQYRPGGGGAVGWTMLTQQKPDGYMMAVTNLPHIVVQPLMTKGVKYKTDQLAPVYLYATTPGGIAVRKDSPFKTLKDLVAYAKKNPKKLSIGGTGKFTGNHLGYLQFTQMADLNTTYISFNGAAPQTAALLGGHVKAIYGGTFIFANNRDKLRVLAVATEKRLADFPDVPTFKELGFDLVTGIDRGVTVPAGTPKDRIEKLAKALRFATSKPKFKEGMAKLGFELKDLGPEQYAKFISAKKQQYVQVLKKAGFLK